MAGGESIDSNLRPNRIPTGERMNQAIGYFFIGFCLKCSYQKQQEGLGDLIVIFFLFWIQGCIIIKSKFKQSNN